MAQLYSTGLVNLMTGGLSVRAILDNCVLRVLSGAAPASADAAETGTLLCVVTIGSGAVAVTDVPTCDNWYFSITPGATAGQHIKVAISIDGVNVTYDHTVTGNATLEGSETKIAQVVAQALRRSPAPIDAIGVSGPSASTGWVAVCPSVRGLKMTMVNGAGDKAIYPVQVLVGARPNTLQFGPPLAGLISKVATDTWTGVNLATGVAGYFRLCLPDDSFALDSVYQYARVQGSIGTSGADMNLDSVQFVLGATTTISGFSIQEPTQ